eukprot:scaffold79467_cov80-Phaeocystis_antarctica.AAC.4
MSGNSAIGGFSVLAAFARIVNPSLQHRWGEEGLGAGLVREWCQLMHYKTSYVQTTTSPLTQPQRLATTRKAQDRHPAVTRSGFCSPSQTAAC